MTLYVDRTVTGPSEAPNKGAAPARTDAPGPTFTEKARSSESLRCSYMLVFFSSNVKCQPEGRAKSPPADRGIYYRKQQPRCRRAATSTVPATRNVPPKVEPTVMRLNGRD